MHQAGYACRQARESELNIPICFWVKLDPEGGNKGVEFQVDSSWGCKQCMVVAVYLKLREKVYRKLQFWGGNYQVLAYCRGGQPFQSEDQMRLSGATRGPEWQTKTPKWGCIGPILQYFYCKAGKSVRRLVLLAMKKYFNVRLDGWSRQQNNIRPTSFWRRAVRNNRCRQTWIRFVAHAQCIQGNS